MNKKITSNWTGSEITESLVRKQISNRWGSEEAEKYNPKVNCLTVRQWNENGYRVKKGETALKSYIVIEKKDKQGRVIETYPKRINLFYQKQVKQV
jgi:hypothetical protein